MYRHALPPGFVLKKDKKKEEKEEEISLEELIENEVKMDEGMQVSTLQSAAFRLKKKISTVKFSLFNVDFVLIKHNFYR